MQKRLSLSEKLAKKKMNVDVAEVTKSKRLELWENLLVQSGLKIWKWYDICETV